MTDQLQDQLVTTDPARTVETFLYALRDKDFDAAEALLADDVIYQNVGYSTVRGRRRTMKLMRGLDLGLTPFGGHRVRRLVPSE